MPVKKNTSAPQRASAPSQKPQGGFQSSVQSDIAVAKAFVMDAVSAVSPEKLRLPELNLDIKLPGDTVLALLVLNLLSLPVLKYLCSRMASRNTRISE
jgi:hypothetical protein